MLGPATAPPELNMGLDQALLEGDDPATLRLYRWAPAGLSLGYFQRSADFARIPGDHVLVRRLTGGGAIYHDDELTWSLALDAHHLPADGPAGYRLLHDAVAAALAGIGVPARFPDAAAPPSARPAEPWCFAGITDLDLVLDGRKLAGSAQRRVRRPRPRLLHHGSIVLRRPRPTPFCAAVADAVDPPPVTALAGALVTHLAGALGLPPRAGDPTTTELGRAHELARSRYADPAFTAGR